MVSFGLHRFFYTTSRYSTKGGKPFTLKQRVGTGLASAPRRTVAVDPVEDKTGAIVVIQQDRIADAMGGDVGDYSPSRSRRLAGGHTLCHVLEKISRFSN